MAAPSPTSRSRRARRARRFRCRCNYLRDARRCGSDTERVVTSRSRRVAARAQNRLRIAQLEQLTNRSALVRGACVVGTGDPVAHPVADIDRAVVFVRRHHAVVHPRADYRITGHLHFVLEVHPNVVFVRAAVHLTGCLRGPRSHGELGEEIGDAFAERVAQQGVVLARGHGPLLGVHRLVHDHDVWVDFQDEMEMASDSIIRTWMYNGMVPPDKNHGAVDIGYWVGNRIAGAYYAGAADKRAAVRELLELRDPEA